MAENEELLDAVFLDDTLTKDSIDDNNRLLHDPLSGLTVAHILKFHAINHWRVWTRSSSSTRTNRATRYAHTLAAREHHARGVQTRVFHGLRRQAQLTRAKGEALAKRRMQLLELWAWRRWRQAHEDVQQSALQLAHAVRHNISYRQRLALRTWRMFVLTRARPLRAGVTHARRTVLRKCVELWLRSALIKQRVRVQAVAASTVYLNNTYYKVLRSWYALTLHRNRAAAVGDVVASRHRARVLSASLRAWREERQLSRASVAMEAARETVSLSEALRTWCNWTWRKKQERAAKEWCDRRDKHNALKFLQRRVYHRKLEETAFAAYDISSTVKLPASPSPSLDDATASSSSSFTLPTLPTPSDTRSYHRTAARLLSRDALFRWRAAAAQASATRRTADRFRAAFDLRNALHRWKAFTLESLTSAQMDARALLYRARMCVRTLRANALMQGLLLPSFARRARVFALRVGMTRFRTAVTPLVRASKTRRCSALLHGLRHWRQFTQQSIVARMRVKAADAYSIAMSRRRVLLSLVNRVNRGRTATATTNAVHAFQQLHAMAALRSHVALSLRKSALLAYAQGPICQSSSTRHRLLHSLRAWRSAVAKAKTDRARLHEHHLRVRALPALRQLQVFASAMADAGAASNRRASARLARDIRVRSAWRKWSEALAYREEHIATASAVTLSSRARAALRSLQQHAKEQRRRRLCTTLITQRQAQSIQRAAFARWFYATRVAVFAESMSRFLAPRYVPNSFRIWKEASSPGLARLARSRVFALASSFRRWRARAAAAVTRESQLAIVARAWGMLRFARPAMLVWRVAALKVENVTSAADAFFAQRIAPRLAREVLARWMLAYGVQRRAQIRGKREAVLALAWNTMVRREGHLRHARADAFANVASLVRYVNTWKKWIAKRKGRQMLISEKIRLASLPRKREWWNRMLEAVAVLRHQRKLDALLAAHSHVFHPLRQAMQHWKSLTSSRLMVKQSLLKLLTAQALAPVRSAIHVWAQTANRVNAFKTREVQLVTRTFTLAKQRQARLQSEAWTRWRTIALAAQHCRRRQLERGLLRLRQRVRTVSSGHSLHHTANRFMLGRVIACWRSQAASLAARRESRDVADVARTHSMLRGALTWLRSFADARITARASCEAVLRVRRFRLAEKALGSWRLAAQRATRLGPLVSRLEQRTMSTAMKRWSGVAKELTVTLAVLARLAGGVSHGKTATAASTSTSTASSSMDESLRLTSTGGDPYATPSSTVLASSVSKTSSAHGVFVPPPPRSATKIAALPPMMPKSLGDFLLSSAAPSRLHGVPSSSSPSSPISPSSSTASSPYLALPPAAFLLLRSVLRWRALSVASSFAAWREAAAETQRIAQIETSASKAIRCLRLRRGLIALASASVRRETVRRAQSAQRLLQLRSAIAAMKECARRSRVARTAKQTLQRHALARLQTHAKTRQWRRVQLELADRLHHRRVAVDAFGAWHIALRQRVHVEMAYRVVARTIVHRMGLRVFTAWRCLAAESRALVRREAEAVVTGRKVLLRRGLTALASHTVAHRVERLRTRTIVAWRRRRSLPLILDAFAAQKATYAWRTTVAHAVHAVSCVRVRGAIRALRAYASVSALRKSRAKALRAHSEEVVMPSLLMQRMAYAVRWWAYWSKVQARSQPRHVTGARSRDHLVSHTGEADPCDDDESQRAFTLSLASNRLRLRASLRHLRTYAHHAAAARLAARRTRLYRGLRALQASAAQSRPLRHAFALMQARRLARIRATVLNKWVNMTATLVGLRTAAVRYVAGASMRRVRRGQAIAEQVRLAMREAQEWIMSTSSSTVTQQRRNDHTHDHDDDDDDDDYGNDDSEDNSSNEARDSQSGSVTAAAPTPAAGAALTDTRVSRGTPLSTRARRREVENESRAKVAEALRRALGNGGRVLLPPSMPSLSSSSSAVVSMYTPVSLKHTRGTSQHKGKPVPSHTSSSIATSPRQRLAAALADLSAAVQSAASTSSLISSTLSQQLSLPLPTSHPFAIMMNPPSSSPTSSHSSASPQLPSPAWPRTALAAMAELRARARIDPLHMTMRAGAVAVRVHSAVDRVIPTSSAPATTHAIVVGTAAVSPTSSISTSSSSREGRADDDDDDHDGTDDVVIYQTRPMMSACFRLWRAALSAQRSIKEAQRKGRLRRALAVMRRRTRILHKTNTLAVNSLLLQRQLALFRGVSALQWHTAWATAHKEDRLLASTKRRRTLLSQTMREWAYLALHIRRTRTIGHGIEVVRAADLLRDAWRTWQHAMISRDSARQRAVAHVSELHVRSLLRMYSHWRDSAREVMQERAMEHVAEQAHTRLSMQRGVRALRKLVVKNMTRQALADAYRVRSAGQLLADALTVWRGALRVQTQRQGAAEAVREGRVRAFYTRNVLVAFVEWAALTRARRVLAVGSRVHLRCLVTDALQRWRTVTDRAMEKRADAMRTTTALYTALARLRRHASRKIAWRQAAARADLERSLRVPGGALRTALLRSYVRQWAVNVAGSLYIRHTLATVVQRRAHQAVADAVTQWGNYTVRRMYIRQREERASASCRRMILRRVWRSWRLVQAKRRSNVWVTLRTAFFGWARLTLADQWNRSHVPNNVKAALREALLQAKAKRRLTLLVRATRAQRLQQAFRTWRSTALHSLATVRACTAARNTRSMRQALSTWLAQTQRSQALGTVAESFAVRRTVDKYRAISQAWRDVSLRTREQRLAEETLQSNQRRRRLLRNAIYLLRSHSAEAVAARERMQEVADAHLDLRMKCSARTAVRRLLARAVTRRRMHRARTVAATAHRMASNLRVLAAWRLATVTKVCSLAFSSV